MPLREGFLFLMMAGSLRASKLDHYLGGEKLFAFTPSM